MLSPGALVMRALQQEVRVERVEWEGGHSSAMWSETLVLITDVI